MESVVEELCQDQNKLKRIVFISVLVFQLSGALLLL